MDRSQRSLQEYFAAARNEDAGISEQEVRAIVEAGPDPRPTAGQEARSRRRAIFSWGAAVILAAGGATALFMSNDKPAVVASAGTSVVQQAVVAPAIPSPQLAEAEAGFDSSVADRPVVSAPKASLATLGRSSVRTERTPAFDQTSRSIESTISTEEVSMNINRLKQFAGAAVVAASVLVTTPPPALAQQSISFEHETSPVMQRFEAEIGSAVYDYWIARLNDYKRTIDRTLSPADLATLNNLRVRFGMMLSEATVDSDVDTRANADGKNETSISIDMSDEEGLAKVQEFFTIFQETKDLAARYQPQFKPLGQGVINDVFGFVDVMSARAEKFAAENQAELAREKDGAALLTMKEEARTMVADLRSEESRMMLEIGYSQFVEPMIMLFDGAELSLFLQQAAPFAKGVTGLNLPDASLLQQSTPNPASGTVSIGYLLNEPSDRTTLRLFNSTGALVGTFDQGSRPAGQNNAMIDVSTYPAGKYLYHLTIQTSKGEQVYSKSMQVVR